MKTIFVKLVDKKSYLFHHPLSATEYFTLSIPPKKSGEVFEVVDIPEVRARIYPGNVLEEVKDPKEYNKIGNQPGDCTFIETSERKRPTKPKIQQEVEPKAADKDFGKPKSKEKANEPK